MTPKDAEWLLRLAEVFAERPSVGFGFTEADNCVWITLEDGHDIRLGWSTGEAANTLIKEANKAKGTRWLDSLRGKR